LSGCSFKERAAQAGLDGIELHSGNGYLFTQFISSAINDRDDQYGGSLANRFLFWREVIEGIRAQADTRDIPLIAKLSVQEGDNAVFPWRSSGNTLEESAQVANWCVDAGANAIHVTAGTIFPHPWNPAGYLPVDFVPRTYKTLIDSGKATWRNYLIFRYRLLRPLARWGWERTLRQKLYSSPLDFVLGRSPPRKGPTAGWRNVEGINRAAAREIRIAISDKTIPVLCTGAFQTLAGIRDALSTGVCDAVTMVRPLLANPDLPAEILAAEERGEANYEAEEPCSLCNRCLLAAPEFPVGCLDDRRFQQRYPEPQARYDAMIGELFDLYRDEGNRLNP
jgi:2,4-dienoyl-CoA reductase-like NADH-dependent reductase (Old Yellow Enzyme family)